ncbi:MAG: DsbA family protein [Pseudomonadota bacterium]
MVRRSLLAAIGAVLLAGAFLVPSPILAQDTEIVPGLERDTFRDEVRAYLLDNPEVILEAIQILEQRRELAAATAELELVAANADALRNDGYSHVGGNPDGTVTVVEFFDYRCGFCKRAHDDVKTLVRTNPDIRLVYKEFPVLGPDSLSAARAAMAALRQDGEAYEKFNDALMRFGGPITDRVIDRLAERSGVDVEQMRADMQDPQIEAQISANHQLAQVLRISGTPTFVIGDRIVRGLIPLDEMNRVVQLARNVAE